MTPTSLAVLQDCPNIMADDSALARADRLSQILARSQLLPSAFRGKPEDVFAAILIAQRMNEDVFTVLQNIHFVSGKPGWAAPFQIARANASGVFSDELSFDTTGDGPSLAVTCSATLRKSGKRVSKTVSLAMAKADGWTKNAKYSAIPEQMLSYRAATFLIRLYCPGILYGLRTDDEWEDIDASRGSTAQGQVELLHVEPPPALPGPPASPSPSPSGPAAPPSGQQPAGVTPPAGPVRGDGPADPDHAERARLISELQHWGASLSDGARKELAAKHGLRSRTDTAKAPLDRLRDLLEAMKRTIADAEVTAGWDDPGSPGGEELRSAVTSMMLAVEDAYGPPGVLEAATKAGLPVNREKPVIDGAPEPLLRRFLATMSAEVTE